ncbi:HBS1 N-terminus [Teratosphaeria destructans]|uniref:HBS1 N-terminus n=1 Tax=Teratosphaeria destructans TaxID=418781 RepID=A0A9W7VY15_9PEZI|nr:HBS1 N-terminus [Teratosphaeria destructans]
MQRNKNIDYDEDDLYDAGDDYAEDEEAYSAEDRDNFATLTPVVRAELEESDITVSDRDIEDALWHYYWDVAKSVAYLKNARAPKPQPPATKKDKPKTANKFDQASQRSAENADATTMPPMSAADWFRDVPWKNVPEYMQGHLSPATQQMPPPKLLGGSSKLAKLAEERRKKAATADSTTTKSASNALDRLTKSKDVKENQAPAIEPKKYPVRKKRDPTPPPREPTPPAAAATEDIPDIRASPTTFGQTLSACKTQAPLASPVTLQDMIGSGAEDPFKGPSPDDVVMRAQQHSKGTFKAAQTSNDLIKKTEALQLDQSEPAPAPKIRSKGLDVLKIWQEQNGKPSAAFVVIGHVDHGKSTLMGRLLLDTGAVSQRDIDRYQKQASEMGKSSFALAWVMDSGTDERERGVTIDIAQHPFSTDAVDFTILDAPGHRDFVPAMIGGASMADIAVLVVDANQLESGMKGQTREHIQLAKAAGLQHVVVAVNKLDSTTPTAWSEQVFDDVKLQITKLLEETGFANDNVRFVPCSALNGDNVAKPPPHSGSTEWIRKSYPTLVKALEGSIPKDPRVNTHAKQPFRLQITDIFRGGIQNPLSIAGRISAGTVQIGETLSIQPSGETVTVKGIEVHGEAREWAVASEITTLHLANDDIEANRLRSGDIACSASTPVAVAKNFEAVVEALDSLLPQAVDVHIGRLNVAGQVKQLVGLVDGGGEITKRRPRLVKAGQRARILLEMEEGIPLAEGSVVVLRARGSTIACGGVVVKGTSELNHEFGIAI